MINIKEYETRWANGGIRFDGVPFDACLRMKFKMRYDKAMASIEYDDVKAVINDEIHGVFKNMGICPKNIKHQVSVFGDPDYNHVSRIMIEPNADVEFKNEKDRVLVKVLLG